MTENVAYKIHRYYRWLMLAFPVIMVFAFFIFYLSGERFPLFLFLIAVFTFINAGRQLNRIEFSGERVLVFDFWGFRCIFDSNLSEFSRIRMGYVNDKCKWFKLYGLDNDVVFRRGDWPDFDLMLMRMNSCEGVVKIKVEGDFNCEDPDLPVDIGHRPLWVILCSFFMVIIAVIISSVSDFKYIYNGELFWLYAVMAPVGLIAAYLCIKGGRKNDAFASSVIVSVFLIPALVFLGLQSMRYLQEVNAERVIQVFVLVKKGGDYQEWRPKKPLRLSYPADVKVRFNIVEAGFKPGKFIGDSQDYEVIRGAFGGIAVRPVIDLKTEEAEVGEVNKVHKHLFDRSPN